jgi:hypothetical protein
MPTPAPGAPGSEPPSDWPPPSRPAATPRHPSRPVVVSPPREEESP